MIFLKKLICRFFKHKFVLLEKAGSLFSVYDSYQCLRCGDIQLRYPVSENINCRCYMQPLPITEKTKKMIDELERKLKK